MKKIMSKFSSDKAASNTTETIIIIALAVFAALALFRFVLTPVQQGAEGLGKETKTILDRLIKGKDPDTGNTVK